MGFLDSIFGGGGDISTGYSEELAQQALALNKEMYEQSREDTAPWREIGTAGINRLATLMGLPGSPGAETRSQIYERLKPQYTTETQAGHDGMFIDPRTGAVVQGQRAGYTDGHHRYYSPEGDLMYRSNIGDEMGNWEAFSPATSTVDTEALNRAVEAEFGGQETPADFGKLTETFDLDKFYESPGYRFRLGEGQKAINRANAARGGFFSPDALKELDEFSQGMAADEYTGAYNRFNQDQGTLYNRLANISGMGQTAVGQQLPANQSYASNATGIHAGMSQLDLARQAANQGSGSIFGDFLSIASLPVGQGSLLGRIFG